MKPRDPSLSFKNPKHEQFALLVAGGAEIGAAYAASGFRPDTSNANRLYARCEGRINYVKVSEVTPKAIEAAAAPMLAAVKEAAEHFVANKEYALDLLYEIAEIASGRKLVKDHIVCRPKDGPPTVIELEFTARNLPSAIRAAELIGREVGMFQEKTPADDLTKRGAIKIADKELAAKLIAKYYPGPANPKTN